MENKESIYVYVIIWLLHLINLALTSNNDDNLHSTSPKENDTGLVFWHPIFIYQGIISINSVFQVSDSVIELLASCHVEVLLDACENLLASDKHVINFFLIIRLKS